jgi:hypothetical protein
MPTAPPTTVCAAAPRAAKTAISVPKTANPSLRISEGYQPSYNAPPLPYSSLTLRQARAVRTIGGYPLRAMVPLAAAFFLEGAC